MSYFDIKRDIEIEKAGGFFCHACVVGKTASEQSSDPRYCQSCYEVLKVEAEMQPTNRRAAWMPKIIKKTTGENVSRETAPDATQTTPALQEAVAKIEQPIIPPTTDKSALLKQRGRPRKEGEVSRATEWRRRKEAEQGVLL